MSSETCAAKRLLVIGVLSALLQGQAQAQSPSVPRSPNPRPEPETPFTIKPPVRPAAKCSARLSKQECAALESELCEFSLYKVSHPSAYSERIPVYDPPKPTQKQDQREAKATARNDVQTDASGLGKGLADEHRQRTEIAKNFGRVDGYTRGYLADLKSYEGLIYSIAYAQEEARQPLLEYALPNNVLGYQCARDKLVEVASAYKARREKLMAEIREVSGSR